MLFLELDVGVLKLADVVAKQLDPFLRLDNRRIRHDAERRIEKVADLGIAIFAGLFPERRYDVVVAARQFIGAGTCIGGIAQNQSMAAISDFACSY